MLSSLRNNFYGLVMLIRERRLYELIQKAFALLKREGVAGLKRSLVENLYVGMSYRKWIRKFDTLSDTDRTLITEHITRLQYQPLISVLMPVYNTPEEWLRRSIQSVRDQIYSHWELCIADDASTLPHVREFIEKAVAEDARIKVTFRPLNGHISAASNTALAMASGEFIALLDHDDELAEHALYMVVAALEKSPHLNLIYSDEDKIDINGHRTYPHFKPDWNPDLLLSQNFVSHLGVYRTSVVRQVGGFQLGVEGCQDWDLALRVSEKIKPQSICHLPYILYHWRQVADSTSVSIEAKAYIKEAALKTIDKYIERNNLKAEAILAWGGFIRVRYRLENPLPKVTIIIPTRNGLALLKQCIESIHSKTEYPDYEILVVDNQSDDPETISYLGELALRSNVNVLSYDAPFNFAAITNHAAGYASGEILCLLNNDTEVISSDWLQEMCGHAMRPEIGVVGGMLYYANDTIQHAGIILGLGGIAGHWYNRSQRGVRGYVGRAGLIQNLSAVTGACMLIRRDVFEQVGGMNEADLPVAYNDVDLCLRIIEAGYRVLWTPYAELYHHESATRGIDDTPEKIARFMRETSYMESRWQSWLEADPAYNPNLSLKTPWPLINRNGLGIGKLWTSLDPR